MGRELYGIALDFAEVKLPMILNKATVQVTAGCCSGSVRFESLLKGDTEYDIPRSLQSNCTVQLKWRHNKFLPRAFTFITYYSSYQSFLPHMDAGKREF
jgi:hypothetical protein